MKLDVDVLFNVGGDFELTKDIILSPKHNNIALFRRNKKYVIFTDTGRSAIYLALKQIISEKENISAWIPFYCCSTVIQPFVQLGFKINYYSMGYDLDSPFGLPEKLSDAVILYIHYFGKENVSLGNYIKRQKKKGHKFLVIEDMVQTCLSRNYGKYGDFLIDSLRKFLPVPDGGIVKSNIRMHNTCSSPNESFISTKIISKFIRGYKGNEKVFLDLYEQGEDIINGEITSRKISYISNYLLKRINIKDIQSKRIDNWKKLLKCFRTGLITSDIISPLYNNLNKGDVPIGLPVIVKDGQRDKFKNYLGKNRIFCAIHWRLNGMEIPNHCSLDVKLSKSILTIPVDHRIDDEKLDYVIKMINSY
tara:strand:- start:1925 stop:3013 length:1089 start_codon:yes stop_codon:yes gene_type:complete